MKPNLTLWRALAIVLMMLPLAYLATQWSTLPERVPIHFNAQGRANGFGSKRMLFYMASLLPVGSYLLLLLLPRLDPKRQLDGSSTNYQKLTLVLMALMSSIACFSIYAAAGGTTVHSGKLLMIGISLFIALLGTYMTTVPPNYFVGIRTPWTLENATVWTQTHRFGGKLFFWGGLLGAVLIGVIPARASSLLVGAGSLGLAAVVWVYSYLAYRQQLNT